MGIVKDHINLITIHGSKGLEFQQVFLVNFHTNTFGISPTEEKYKDLKPCKGRPHKIESEAERKILRE
jgi:ATP-dependent exoDNAse (exonuclease V) beta subunit